VSLADPPLSRTIGVALADGSVAVFFERGAPLPSRKTFRLRTSLTVHPGQKESAVTVPVVQGEVEIARLCRLVGRIDIRPESLKKPLPAGSPVEIVMELDRGGKLTANAYLPDEGIHFPGALVLVAPDATVDELGQQLERQRERIVVLYASSHVPDAGQKKLVALDARLLEVETELEAAGGGDVDALEKARRMLIDADAGIADVEALGTWPELEDEALGWISFAMHWVSAAGTDMERRTLEEALRSLDRARAVKSAADFSKRLRVVKDIGHSVRMRDPRGIGPLLDRAAARIGEMRDPRAGRRHLEEGRKALAANDVDGARKSLEAAWQLLPPPEEVRAKAHGSGVER
jgi:molecular chaperone DnaK